MMVCINLLCGSWGYA